MKLPVADLVRCVTDLQPPEGSVLVGIDGSAGSGKTTFARRLADRFADGGQDVSLVSVDGFYKCSAERWTGSTEDQPIGHDLDWERLRDQVLIPLGTGQRARYRPYNWPEDRLEDPVTVDPVGIVVIEGVFALRDEISHLYDLRVWFTCPSDLRAARVLERGDMTSDELDRWMPGEEAYVASHRPEEYAHLVVDGAAVDDCDDPLEAVHWSPP